MTTADRLALKMIADDTNRICAAIRAINTRIDEHGFDMPKFDDKPFLQMLTRCAVLKHPAKKTA